MRVNFGRDDVQVLPNLLGIPSMRSADEDQGYVLWVGSLARRKRPELFLELARLCPGTEFRLVGGPGEDTGYDEEMRAQAADIDNLNWLGFVPPPEMDAQYRGASIYVNTSALEGLPNAFLQSWSHGVPTVSAGVDPDGVIQSNKLGGVAGTAAGMAKLVGALLSDPAERTAAGQRCHDHVSAGHDIGHVGALAEEYLQAAVDCRHPADR